MNSAKVIPVRFEWMWRKPIHIEQKHTIGELVKLLRAELPHCDVLFVTPGEVTQALVSFPYRSLEDFRGWLAEDHSLSERVWRVAREMIAYADRNVSVDGHFYFLLTTEGV